MIRAQATSTGPARRFDQSASKLQTETTDAAYPAETPPSEPRSSSSRGLRRWIWPSSKTTEENPDWSDSCAEVLQNPSSTLHRDYPRYRYPMVPREGVLFKVTFKPLLAIRRLRHGAEMAGGVERAREQKERWLGAVSLCQPFKNKTADTSAPPPNAKHATS